MYTVLKSVIYGFFVTLVGIIGACFAHHNGSENALVVGFLVGFIFLCLVLLAEEEHRREEMALRDWYMRMGRRDSGYDA
jgi:uncharacterized membrane protein YdcZ (DUF606 family)